MEKRKRRSPKRKAEEVIDFSGSPLVHAWLIERAEANHRTISQEVVHRLSVQKKNVEKGARNLHQGKLGGLTPAGRATLAAIAFKQAKYNLGEAAPEMGKKNAEEKWGLTVNEVSTILQDVYKEA